MADRQSLGPLQVLNSTPIEINRVLQELVDRIDAVNGLRGRVIIHDRVQVSNPVNPPDAVNLGSLETTFVGTATPLSVESVAAVGVSSKLSRQDHVHRGLNLEDAQEITGLKTFTGISTRWVDDVGVLIHAFGTKV